MKALSDYRASARAALSGKWGTSALFYFTYSVVALIASAACSIIPGVGTLAAELLLLPIAYGMVVGFLRQARGEEQEIGWLFENFNGRVWFTSLLALLYTILWTLLFIIPGCIKSYSYAMTQYILHDNPELENNAAIEKSMAMMDGHKWELFLLDLTFIGWYLLSILTLCIGLFWVIPYHQTARAAFYEDLKAAV